MHNTTKVKLLQETPEIARRVFSRAVQSGDLYEVQALYGVDDFPATAPKTKRALVSLSPSAYLQARAQYPGIRYFNHAGLAYEIVKALNESGYLVDIVDFRCEYSPSTNYDLFVGHGGNCRSIVECLRPETPILQYVSGAHWAAFNAQSEERYRRFSQAHGFPFHGQFRRSLDGLTEGEEYLSRKATYMFTIKCPRMVAGYGDLARKFVFTGLGAYTDPLMGSPSSKTHSARNRFLYVGGTGGNIQKGLDLFIDAFKEMPELELYVYCKVERDIVDYAATNFNAPNVHYIYHWRYRPFHQQLRHLFQTVSFTLHAPIDSGLGTAFSASLASGLIPVGYVDYAGNREGCILSEAWDVSSLCDCLQSAANKSQDWCRMASGEAQRFYEQHCTPEGFYQRFKRLVESVS